MSLDFVSAKVLRKEAIGPPFFIPFVCSWVFPLVAARVFSDEPLQADEYHHQREYPLQVNQGFEIVLRPHDGLCGLLSQFLLKCFKLPGCVEPRARLPA